MGKALRHTPSVPLSRGECVPLSVEFEHTGEWILEGGRLGGIFRMFFNPLLDFFAFSYCQHVLTSLITLRLPHLAGLASVSFNADFILMIERPNEFFVRSCYENAVVRWKGYG